MIRASLFACVIAAAVGCRSDRDDVEYGRTIEPAGVPYDQEPPRTTGEMVRSGASTDLGIEGDRSGAGAGAAASAPEGSSPDVNSGDVDSQTDEAGHPVREPGGERELDSSGTVNRNTGADVQGRRRTWTSRPAQVRIVPRIDAGPPPAPTSSTSSGNGTTTNTGINTENAGTGG